MPTAPAPAVSRSWPARCPITHPAARPTFRIRPAKTPERRRTSPASGVACSVAAASPRSRSNRNSRPRRSRLGHNGGMNASPRSLAALLPCLLLAACSTAPQRPVPAAPEVTPAQRLAAVQAAAGAADTELDVRPLRDPQVADLRERATAALAAGQVEAAADALNQALLIVPDDPVVLQERAEVALLQAQYDRAETLARRAYDLGSRVGPMCRRHWATIEQSRLARGRAENAASAKAQLATCTVPGVQRFRRPGPRRTRQRPRRTVHPASTMSLLAQASREALSEG